MFRFMYLSNLLWLSILIWTVAFYLIWLVLHLIELDQLVDFKTTDHLKFTLNRPQANPKEKKNVKNACHRQGSQDCSLYDCVAYKHCLSEHCWVMRRLVLSLYDPFLGYIYWCFRIRIWCIVLLHYSLWYIVTVAATLWTQTYYWIM